MIPDSQDERSQQAELAKARKLLDALCEPHENVEMSGDHEWRKCRRCLAVAELEHDGPALKLLRALKKEIEQLATGAAALEQQEKNDHARCVEPQLRAGESDPRADHRGRSERCQHCDGHGAIFDTDDMERNCPECVDGLAQKDHP